VRVASSPSQQVGIADRVRVGVVAPQLLLIFFGHVKPLGAPTSSSAILLFLPTGTSGVPFADWEVGRSFCRLGSRAFLLPTRTSAFLLPTGKSGVPFADWEVGRSFCRRGRRRSKGQRSKAHLYFSLLRRGEKLLHQALLVSRDGQVTYRGPLHKTRMTINGQAQGQPLHQDPSQSLLDEFTPWGYLS
jgi:hypothetical protein